MEIRLDEEEVVLGHAVTLALLSSPPCSLTTLTAGRPPCDQSKL